MQEEEVRPKCVVRPDNAKDVSLAVAILTVGEKFIPGKCQFAVRGGGHTPWAGAANIQGGVTIDLANLNQVTVAGDRSSVIIGPGNRWGDVYGEITPQGLAIGGGRVAIVGVGGLVTGGELCFWVFNESLQVLMPSLQVAFLSSRHALVSFVTLSSDSRSRLPPEKSSVPLQIPTRTSGSH